MGQYGSTVHGRGGQVNNLWSGLGQQFMVRGPHFMVWGRGGAGEQSMVQERGEGGSDSKWPAPPFPEQNDKTLVKRSRCDKEGT